MNTSADVIIVGTGSVGSMAAWHLASRGFRVVGIDRSSIPGPFSAYAGESRLFRMIYREGAQYTPLLTQSRDLWRKLEAESDRSLLRTTGGVTISKVGNDSFEDLLEVNREQGLEHELVSGAEARARLPLHDIHDDSVALFDPNSGYVLSEQGVTAAVQRARIAGAEFLEHRTVLAIEQRGEQWQVRTDRETVQAPRVILATGTGAGALCGSLNTHLAVLPQVLAWFPIRDPKAYAEQTQQIFLRYESDTKFYGFPSADGWTAKVAASVYLDEVDTYDHPFELQPSYLEPVIAAVAKYLPGLEPRPVRTALCADGYLDDHTALLGPVRGLDGIIAAVGLSGHGFKMAPALGTAAAEFAVEGASRIDVSFMDPNRHLGAERTLTEVAVG